MRIREDFLLFTSLRSILSVRIEYDLGAIAVHDFRTERSLKVGDQGIDDIIYIHTIKYERRRTLLELF